jgi:hypothetical protein
VTSDQTVLLALAGLGVLCLLLGLALLVVTRRLRGAAARSQGEVDALRTRLERLEERDAAPRAAAAPVAAPVEFVITDLGRAGEPEPQREPVHLDGAAFADVVLKETVVKAASLAHGVRRGLAPVTRNRIRFEMKQEVRRSRKQRRADLKAAQRDLYARQRAGLAAEHTEAAS